MHLSLINPYIRVVMHSTLLPHSTIKRRVIFDYELIYIEKGHFTFIYDDKQYDCKPGDILLIMPGVPHSFHMSEEELFQPHIHFDVTQRPESENICVSFKDKEQMSKIELSWIHENYFSNFPVNPLMRANDKKQFCDLFYKTISAESEGSKLTAKGLLTQLFAMLIKDNFPALFSDQKKLSVAKQIKEFIDSEQGYTMKLDDFEKMFFYDKFYLEKIFTAEYGKSLIKYRNEKRMEHAKILLKSYSVSRVSDNLGFSSIYAFSRAYKQHFGYAPSAEREHR